MKKIIDRKTGKVWREYEDSEVIIISKETIHIPNIPPARVVGNTTYLGGTHICDRNIKDSALIEEKAGKFIETVVGRNGDITEVKYNFNAVENKYTKV